MTRRKSNIIFIGVIRGTDADLKPSVPKIGTFSKITSLAKFLEVHYNTAYRWVKTSDLLHGEKSIIITTLNHIGEKDDV